MAYQFADGFDNYGNSYQLTAGYPWDTIIGGGTQLTSTADFQFAPPAPCPGGCLIISNSTSIRKNLSSNQSTIIMSFAFKLTTLPSSTPTDILAIWDAGTEQVGLSVSGSGVMQFFRGSVGGGTSIGTSTPPATIAAGVWYSVALQVVVGTGTAGSVQLFLNGAAVPVINSTGLNTSNTGNSFANQVSIGAGVNVGQGAIRYDDFFCFDGSGVTLNSVPSGPTRIVTKMPNGAGNYTNWTPTGLSSNWQNAAVQPPSTSDYNANNVSTTKDSYGMQISGLGVPPLFMLLRASLERDDAGPHTPSIFVRSATVDSSGTATAALGASYAWYDSVVVNDPATSSPWTGAGADAAQPGIIEG